MKSPALEQVKDFIRQPYAWPGGYPLVLIMSDGECLCPACARDNFNLIAAATLANANDGWKASGVQINYEDNDLYCSNCNAHIECAYSDD